MSCQNASGPSFPWRALGVLLDATLSSVRENRETRWVRPALCGTGLGENAFHREIEKTYLLQEKYRIKRQYSANSSYSRCFT